jgi:pilus assembly protein CpaC
MRRKQRMSRTALGILLFSLTAGGVATLAAHAEGEGNRMARREAGAKMQPIPNPGGAQATPGARQMIISIGVTERLQMKSKKEIKRVVNPKENVAVISPVDGDPTAVTITGREAGTTRVTLTAVDDTEEVYDVVVQLDIEYLRMLLQRAAPTASLNLIPGAGGVVIIGGVVNHADDIDIIMRAAQSVVGGADRIVNAMRVAGVQLVQLDAVVAFVSRSELRRMSFDFLNTGLHHNFSSTVGGALINPQPGATLPTFPGIGIPIANVSPNSPNGAPVNFFLGLFNDEQIFYSFLQILRNENLAKIMAEPKVVTMSGRTARLLSGGQQAIPETAGLGSVSVRFEPFGTQLNVLPIVLGNGKIQLDVNPIVSNIDASVGTAIAGTIVPGRNQQEVQTTVIVETGQTLVIGGLIQNTVTAVVQKVPFLGDLPIIGAAFSSKSYQEVESELVILITPHLVDPMSCDQLPKYYPGQETRSPDDYELFLEGILEAPRGQRVLCPGGKYMPAYMNGPTADTFPCGNGYGKHGKYGACSNGSCQNGSCNDNGACPAPTNHVAPAPVKTAGEQPVDMDGKWVPTPATQDSAKGANPNVLPAHDGTQKVAPAGAVKSSLEEVPAKSGRTFRLPDVPDAASSPNK